MDTKRKEHAALDKDYKAYEDAKKALEAAKAKASEAKEAVKTARAAVLEALKTVSDPPATVSPFSASWDLHVSAAMLLLIADLLCTCAKPAWGPPESQTFTCLLHSSWAHMHQ